MLSDRDSALLETALAVDLSRLAACIHQTTTVSVIDTLNPNWGSIAASTIMENGFALLCLNPSDESKIQGMFSAASHLFADTIATEELQIADIRKNIDERSGYLIHDRRRPSQPEVTSQRRAH